MDIMTGEGFCSLYARNFKRWIDLEGGKNIPHPPQLPPHTIASSYVLPNLRGHLQSPLNAVESFFHGQVHHLWGDSELWSEACENRKVDNVVSKWQGTILKCK